jgi:ubiquinone biosynthesis protein
MVLTKLKDELRALFIHYVSSHQASRYNWSNLLISLIRIGMCNYGGVPTGLALFAKGWSAAEGTARWLSPKISYHELVESADIQIMKSILALRFEYRAAPH